VNNASKDNTVEIAYAEWGKYNSNKVPFRVVDQLIPGLIAAREKGLEVSNYEYLLYCDDDNWLNQNYIALAYEIVSNNPRIGMLGGVGEAVCEIAPPAWFEKLKYNYAVGEQSPKSGDITESKSYVYGAGSIMKKSVWLFLLENGFVSLLTGRKGKALSSGEDMELGIAFSYAGYRIWYDNRLKFKHYITKERLTWEYVVKLMKAFALTQVKLWPYTNNSTGKPYLWLRDMRFIVERVTANYLHYLKSGGNFKKDNLLYLDLIYNVTILKEFIKEGNNIYINNSRIAALKSKLAQI